MDHERSECEPARAKQSRDERSECEPARAKQSRDERSRSSRFDSCTVEAVCDRSRECLMKFVTLISALLAVTLISFSFAPKHIFAGQQAPQATPPQTPEPG